MSTANKALEGAVKTNDGVQLSGVILQPIVEQCSGCDRVRNFEEQEFCGSYPTPAKKWSLGRCNFATHVKAAATVKVKTNPLKASKRAAKGH